ncbi:MAG: hypothetical protein GEV03_05580 [Streptosporangiales bacterium]|nr:hypothetical protein [Streptosporangiales bacterium]
MQVAPGVEAVHQGGGGPVRVQRHHGDPGAGQLGRHRVRRPLYPVQRRRRGRRVRRRRLPHLRGRHVPRGVGRKGRLVGGRRGHADVRQSQQRAEPPRPPYHPCHPLPRSPEMPVSLQGHSPPAPMEPPRGEETVPNPEGGGHAGWVTAPPGSPGEPLSWNTTRMPHACRRLHGRAPAFLRTFDTTSDPLWPRAGT